MTASKTLRLRQAIADDAPLFYNVIDRTMREFIVTTWGAWNEERVQHESSEDSSSPNAQVIQIDDISIGVLVVEQCRRYTNEIYQILAIQEIWIEIAIVKQLSLDKVGSAQILDSIDRLAPRIVFQSQTNQGNCNRLRNH